MWLTAVIGVACGAGKKCFFQKHDSGTFDDHAHHVPIREKDGGVEDYLYLDNAEGLDFPECARAARDIRTRLADLGLVSFAMLSGGKGVHVVVPLKQGHDWDTHKDFARRFAEAMSLAQPKRYVATMSKAKRKGRIFIDWLRNQRGATAVLPYSARAREGAPVAVPISWDELDAMKDAHPFSIDDTAKLAERARGLRGWGFSEQSLPGL